MRKTSYVALTSFILLCFSILPSLANPQMNISSSGTINYPGSSSGQIKILRQSFQWGRSASEWASTIDVYQGHYDALGIVPQIKAIRPDVLAFVYFNLIDLWTAGHPEYDAAKYSLFMANGWVLKDIYGEYVMTSGGWSYYMDFGHPGYHAWLANWFKNYIDTYGLDGASLDNWFTDSMVWYGTTQTAKNPRTGEEWTNQEICDAYKAMTLKIREVLGSNKIILVNGVYNGNHFYGWRNPTFVDGILNGGVDAVMSEGWVSLYDASEWYSEEMWKLSIDFAVWLENNFPAKGGKYFMSISGDESFLAGNSFPPDMSEAQYQQYVTYCYASFLLAIKNLVGMIGFGNYIDSAYPQSLFKINMGTPSESYHTLGSSHVYARKFSGGMVLVNPTYNSYTVTIGSGYKNAVTGSSVSSTLTVQPHTGLILTTA